MNWNEEAARIIKAAKSRHGVEWKDIAELLDNELGVELSAQTIANRVNNGAFSFAFALQILAVLKVKHIEVPPIK
ncbi:hypothetical protein FKG94_10115 [Exilibacterium tricleocarpae]|uniref:DUF6471 domain-containing protein n=1 Tax=Exilibacterium tricleocarpae TaxID=2591008 RepID=A0A545TV54_9GAMM|nr:DUF6471 domain-containing protein [Exilibacterium tricleocarpae]TQV81041.1 hypothetical protein FKG94_10115 [Exilibacterium tricleocarpae]